MCQAADFAFKLCNPVFVAPAVVVAAAVAFAGKFPDFVFQLMDALVVFPDAFQDASLVFAEVTALMVFVTLIFTERLVSWFFLQGIFFVFPIFIFVLVP